MYEHIKAFEEAINGCNDDGCSVCINPLNIFENKGFETLKKFYINKATKGHANRQHWYPDFLIKMFNSQLNMQYFDIDDKKPIPKGVQPQRELYSAVKTWTEEVEGLFTGVEGLVSDFLDYKEQKTPLGIYYLAENNYAFRVCLSLLIFINLYRNPKSFTFDKENGQRLTAEYVFLDKSNIDYIIESAYYIANNRWFAYPSSTLKILFSEECIKTIPKNFSNYEAYNNMDITNSAIYMPLSSENILIITPMDETTGYIDINAFRYHQCFTVSNGYDLNDLLFDNYNRSSLMFGEKCYANNKDILFIK